MPECGLPQTLAVLAGALDGTLLPWFGCKSVQTLAAPGESERLVTRGTHAMAGAHGCGGGDGDGLGGPVPTVAVTAMGTVLVVSAGNDVATVVVARAVLTGQLSIGWSNDLVDVRRDAASGRRDKPLATGAVSPRVVAAATAVATTVTVVSSLALGWRAGLAQLCVVASGWVYNYPLKSTPLSPLPFFVAFGTLPAVATLALSDRPGHRPGCWWPPV